MTRLLMLLGAGLVPGLMSCGILNGVSEGALDSPLAGVFNSDTLVGPDGGGRCGGGAVVLRTIDGVSLNATWSPAAQTAIVLVHESVGDHTNWSPESFSYFEDQGYAVLSFDRRRQARDDLPGSLDVKAAEGFLGECGINTWGVVGAAEGTTAIFDHLLSTPGPLVASPTQLKSVVFLSPGPWTDKNNPSVGDHLSILEQYAGFSAVTTPNPCCGTLQLDPVPAAWQAQDYAGAQDSHGARMLEGVVGRPLRDDLAVFLSTNLPIPLEL